MTGELIYQNNTWFVKYKSYEQTYPRSGRDIQGNEEYEWIEKILPIDINRDSKLQMILTQNFKQGKKVKFIIEKKHFREDPLDESVWESVAILQEQIDNISIGEGCFGPYVRINQQDLHKHEYANQDEIKQIDTYKQMLFDELKQVYDKLDMHDLQQIAQIIVNRGEWIEDDTKSHNDTCDQCGNYNWGQSWDR